uniref:DB domain-containing protein n=1 Tax=Steinernema glaseri TaxID=37863 RepID=A0A1I7Z594_9BILA
MATMYLLLGLLAVLVQLIVKETAACASSGCCAPPPSSVSCGGCGGGYGCGRYGCYKIRHRVASAKTVAVDGEDDIPDGKSLSLLASPDERFMECCERRNLPDACLSKCSFRTYTKEALQAMYFRSDKCPIQAASEIHFCAAQGRDHRACCARNGVGTTLSGEKCMVFCDQRPGRITPLDYSYAACYERFESMKSCFWHNITGEINHFVSASGRAHVNDGHV